MITAGLHVSCAHCSVSYDKKTKQDNGAGATLNIASVEASESFQTSLQTSQKLYLFNVFLIFRMTTAISSAFWSPYIWLPPNVTWEDFESRPDSAKFNHLLIPIPLALGLVLLRLVLEHRVFKPLGSWLGIPSKR